jgi:hypothetical protein
MGRLGLALKILFNGEIARQMAEALTGNAPSAIEQSAPAPVPAPATRSEAVTLLAALQRDARFVDFIQEPIDGYSDAQVGAAVRDVHRGCCDVLNRMFGLQPVTDQPEDSSIEVTDSSSAQWRLTGNVGQSSGPVTGKLMHSGWKTSKCQVPDWNGSDADATVVASAEVQIA